MGTLETKTEDKTDKTYTSTCVHNMDPKDIVGNHIPSKYSEKDLSNRNYKTSIAIQNIMDRNINTNNDFDQNTILQPEKTSLLTQTSNLPPLKKLPTKPTAQFYTNVPPEKGTKCEVGTDEIVYPSSRFFLSDNDSDDLNYLKVVQKNSTSPLKNGSRSAGDSKSLQISTTYLLNRTFILYFVTIYLHS